MSNNNYAFNNKFSDFDYNNSYLTSNQYRNNSNFSSNNGSRFNNTGVGFSNINNNNNTRNFGLNYNNQNTFTTTNNGNNNNNFRSNNNNFQNNSGGFQNNNNNFNNSKSNFPFNNNNNFGNNPNTANRFGTNTNSNNFGNNSNTNRFGNNQNNNNNFGNNSNNNKFGNNNSFGNNNNSSGNNPFGGSYNTSGNNTPFVNKNIFGNNNNNKTFGTGTGFSSTFGTNNNNKTFGTGTGFFNNNQNFSNGKSGNNLFNNNNSNNNLNNNFNNNPNQKFSMNYNNDTNNYNFLNQLQFEAKKLGNLNNYLKEFNTFTEIKKSNDFKKKKIINNYENIEIFLQDNLYGKEDDVEEILFDYNIKEKNKLLKLKMIDINKEIEEGNIFNNQNKDIGFLTNNKENFIKENQEIKINDTDLKKEKNYFYELIINNNGDIKKDKFDIKDKKIIDLINFYEINVIEYEVYFIFNNNKKHLYEEIKNDSFEKLYELHNFDKIEIHIKPLDLEGINYLPIFHENGYLYNPSIEQLKKLSLMELKKVENLEIKNAFVDLKFLKPVDLTFTNLKNIILEKHSFIIDKKYKRGEKFNQPVMIIFKKFNPIPDKDAFNNFSKTKQDSIIKKYQKNLKFNLEKMRCEYIDWNINTEELQFKKIDFS